MKYLCLAYGDPAKMGQLTDEQFARLVEQCKLHDEELKKTGAYVWAESLEWGGASLRARGGKTVTTDGPFIEAKEQIGGVVMIEARDLNEAIRIASLHPAARMGEAYGWGIDVRPVAAGCHK